MKNIKEVNNQLVSHWKREIEKFFFILPVGKIQVEFFIGKDEKDESYFCFFLSSDLIGEIYEKVVRIENEDEIDELEKEFVSNLIFDFLIAGSCFVIIEKVKENRKKEKIIDNLNRMNLTSLS